jgi:rfaE bifunctional protein kinase chain/domain
VIRREAPRFTRKEARDLLGRMRGKRILVIGDLMLDRYVYGRVTRISPEAPVPVVHVTREQAQPGGAANVALNVQSLGGQAIVAGIIARDKAGDELNGLLEVRGISTEGVFRPEGTTTTVKTRVMAERQQVVRVDREDAPQAIQRFKVAFADMLVPLIKGVDGVILEDYGKGTVSQAVIDTVLPVAAEVGIPVGFDPKDDRELRIRGLTLATPNYKEACLAAGVSESVLTDPPEQDPVLIKAGQALLDRWNCGLVLITLGPHGMCLFAPDAEPYVMPTRAREVFDVSGAGDTVIATALLASVAGADRFQAASLANHAAGVVVGKLGTAVCSPDELLKAVA